MATELERERSLGKHLDKQTGCVAGFFQLFDRNQILTGKRILSAKRRHSSPVVDTMSSESESSDASSPVFIGKAKQLYCKVAFPSPERAKQSPLRSPAATVAESPPPLKSPIPLPILELKDGGGSSWRFWKEVPRLSLDSRASTDAKGGLHPKQFRTGASILSTADGRESFASVATDETLQHRSPSLVVRLMGLEPFPDSNTPELPESRPELQRSASESRLSGDFFPSRNVSEGSNSSYHQTTKYQSASFNNVAKVKQPIDARCSGPRSSFPRNAVKAESPKAFNRGSSFNSPSQRKSFFISGDFFPEPKQKKSSLYEEVENRLKMRGVSEHAKDLETLKQILEALQLKGLLHSRESSEENQVRRRNFVHDESPWILSASSQLNRRMRHGYSPGSPRRERNVRSPTRSENITGEERRSNCALVKRKSLNVETRRRISQPTENRRVIPDQTRKLGPGKIRPDSTASNKSPRSKKITGAIQKEKITTIVAAEDESSTSSIDAEMQRVKGGEYKEETKLLDRCDKLIHSITEMTNDMQPSPVSVLDSFYKDELRTPSPITMKRNIDLEDHSAYPSDELEDGTWSPMISPVLSKCEQISSNSDLMYISDILRATHRSPEDLDVFLLLEKQQCLKGKDISKLSLLQRKVIFDTVNEILDRNRLLPPWSVMNRAITKPSLDEIWSELQRIREQTTAQDMFDTVCDVLKKDLDCDAITGWGNNQVEMSEMVLVIERLVFKDLITETIRDLVGLEPRNISSSIKPRRKLTFCKQNYVVFT